ncbi:hypothetical protein U875_09475 [Pandoraea pnomenusa 3kgm]|uniref:hypothetical protein n=1 Tax=Pandoraea pnomenusa TaxID=93220 RepID=UPI0003C76B18|nr:hypothetical protein [Pandoraea pnomenusa]AHB08374.1 hypothetical protein U875_09475 [Pandoraea pnomenusa 3kgm]
MRQVDRDVLDDIRVVLLIVFGAVLGVVIAYIWPWKTTVSSAGKDWVDVATAIGTVGAAAVAGAIALRDARWRRETKESEAVIAWGLVSDELRVKADELREVVAIFVRDPDRMRRSSEGYQVAKRVSADLALTIPHDMLIKLASLPGGRGGYIAGAVGLFPSIRRLLEVYVSTGSQQEIYTTRIMAISKIEQALRNIEVAFRDTNDRRMK